MKLVSFAINVVFHWLTNNSVQRPKRFIAAIVMTHSLPVAVMVVGKFFVRVRMVQFNSFNFTLFFFFPLFNLTLGLFFCWLIYWPHPIRYTCIMYMVFYLILVDHSDASREEKIRRRAVCPHLIL